MLFNVSVLLREPVGSTRRYELAPEGPVRGGHVELVRMPAGVLVRCTADVEIEASCSRCLGEVRYDRTVSFEEVYAQQVDVVTGAPLPEPDDADAFRIETNHTIDISEAVRQYGEMAAEMRPLCRPDCPGLCSECGQDLSQADCACDRTRVDPRWAALAALKRTVNG